MPEPEKGTSEWFDWEYETNQEPAILVDVNDETVHISFRYLPE